MKPLRLLPIALGLFVILPKAPAQVDFRRDILPILSDTCYHCHGPDASTRKGGLRLDTQEGIFRTRKGRANVTPRQPMESELYRRLVSPEADVRMPPPEAPRHLNPSQIELVRRWIAEGATWGEHWAFVPLPRQVPIPEGPASVAPIDRFLQARLKQTGFVPAPEASREVWLRRVTLDLTGLPPTLGEMDSFLEDQAPGAHERVLTRLFSSPRYGERLATEWLDVARYADTHGYQMDRYRAMWPYRDWVVRAFQRNLPYDQFVTWQLAGDLLPGATREQRLATAFNRLHMQNEEGGVVEEEFRVAYVVDRVTTFGTAFLGLTLECARCHDHKYDPIRMKDFYSLFAFFQNIDESGQTPYFTPSMPVPTLLLSDDALEARLSLLRQDIAHKEQNLAQVRGQAREAFRNWLKTRPPVLVPPGCEGSYSFEDIQKNTMANGIAGGRAAQAQEGPMLVAGKKGRAVALSGENGFTFPGVGTFRRSDPFSLALWIRPPEPTARQVILHHSRAPIDAGSRGYELLMENGQIAFGLHHMWPRNSLKIVASKPLPTHVWSHVTVTYDGSSRASGVALYVDGKPQAVQVIRDGLFKDITYESGEPPLTLGHRFRDSGFKGGQVDELQVYRRALTELEAAHLAGQPEAEALWSAPPGTLNDKAQEKLFEVFIGAFHEPTRAAAEDLRQARIRESDAVQPIPEVMVMEEMKEPRATFILRRGAYDAPGEPVTADTPSSLPPYPAGQPRNRLGLVRWLLAPDHPLMARVTVNRYWQMLFGRGLVETSDNLGSQGAQPSHPELLDWLARDFLDHGWDLRRLLTQMVLSQAYRQSSRTGLDGGAADPENRFLARAPARRLTAEMLRDQALFLSGLLVERLGGPGVKPYQPEGLWEVAMGRPHYDRSRGPDLYRRSLYTFWKRTVPHPAMITFDAAERNVCSARRQSTSTPLQALALLNDPQIVEAARKLGERLLREGGKTPRDQVIWAFRLATGRQPQPRETDVLVRMLEEQRNLFLNDTKSGERLLAIGEAPRDPTLPMADAAAAAIVALTLLNHDEVVMRR